MKILENYIAPTEHSQGDVGDIWIDKSTGDVYKCTGLTGSAKDLGYIAIGADATNTNYMWEKLGGNDGMFVVETNEDFTQVITPLNDIRDAWVSGQMIILNEARGNRLFRYALALIELNNDGSVDSVRFSMIRGDIVTTVFINSEGNILTDTLTFVTSLEE